MQCIPGSGRQNTESIYKGSIILTALAVSVSLIQIGFVL